MNEILNTSYKSEREAAMDYTRNKMNILEKNVTKTEITREGNLAYYKVQSGDTTEIIRNKLARKPEFSYLSQSSYKPDRTGRSVNGFNITNSSLKPGMNLMVPIKIEKRQVEDNAFISNCKTAINNMKSNPIYGPKIKKLVSSIGENDLARVMSAFARVETACGNKSVKIGTGGLYRYENTDTYSISYFHIIPKWGGLSALQKLNMNKGDTCNPIKAGMFFLGFWCEIENDVKRKGLTLEKCLNPNMKGWYINAAKIYNSGSKSYSGLLKNSLLD